MAEVKVIAVNESLISFWQFQGANSYVDSLFLMGSPFPILLIWASYMLFVLKCGQKFMENRSAYNLRTLLLVYNASQVALSCYNLINGSSGLYDFGILEKGYCFNELSDDKVKIRLFNGYHIFFITKLTELMDTVFFVLRKKWSQVTFLHIYHHSLMYLATWLILKYEPTYSLIFLGAINSYVHVIMYTYYSLAAFPSLAKHLWWKKYITKLQLIQFVLAVIHGILNWNVSTCPPSYILLSTVAFNLLLFIYLFAEFYKKNYINAKSNNENELKKQ